MRSTQTNSGHLARTIYAKKRITPRLLFTELLESRIHLSATVESVDGTGNNLANTAWGSAGTDLIRLAAAAYADGVSSPALPTDLSARAISNILNSQAVSATDTTDIATVDKNLLSDFGYSFGQFMDHDLDLTPDGGASLPIAVAASDPMGPNPIPFTRSITDPATGTSIANPAQQVTTVTSYLDLSQVYGSNATVASALRTFQNGLMKTSPGNMLPYDNTTYFTTAQIAALNMANDSGAAPTSALFATGDRRGNENIELTALQTLFVRNHNKIAAELKSANPAWNDEQLYQEARKLNIAEYQNIIYNGWIPAVLGRNALSSYAGYKSNVNATISNEFSTVAFRFGHSLLSADIERQSNSGADIADVTGDSDISLAEDFFDPYLLNPSGVIDPLTGHTSSDIAPILKAESDGVSQATDLTAVNDIRNLLFGNGGSGGEDLMARDVQRDRDNGIPDYNTLRAAVGLPKVSSFAQISKDPKVQAELAAAYPGGVNSIDAFEGGLAEDHVAGSDVGPLFQRIMVDQFTRLRDGDRFFYLNENFSQAEMNIFSQGNTLAEVIEGNSPVTNLQADIFTFHASVSGTVSAPNQRRPPRSGSVQIAGALLDLVNADGVVVAMTHTDSRGNYSFTQLSTGSGEPTVASGLSSTGTYQVVLVEPVGSRQAAPPPITVTISSADTNVRNVNFGPRPITQQPPPRPNLVAAAMLSQSQLKDRLT